MPTNVHRFAGPMATATKTAVPGRYACSAGELVVPITYRRTRSVIVTVPAPLESLKALLPPSIRPRRLYGPYGSLVVQFVDLVDTTIGPYTESVVAVVAEDSFEWPAPPDDTAWDPRPCYAIWLSVSNELARVSGQAIWGYPKTIGDVEFRVEGADFYGRVMQGGNTILDCKAKCSLDSERSVIRMRSLTHLEDRTCRTITQGPCLLTPTHTEPGELRVFPGSPITEALASVVFRADEMSTIYIRDYDYELGHPIIDT
jgi:hypothetical protein